MKIFKFITTLIFILLITTANSQTIDQCGLDDDYQLTQAESDYLNNYVKEKPKDFDFTNKKIIIVAGPSGQQIGSKKQYFKDIKNWLENGDTIATTLIVFNEEEQIKSGCDGILTLWVKIFTEKGKRRIIKKVEATNK